MADKDFKSSFYSVVVPISDTGKVLLARRKDDFLWTTPAGGNNHSDESPEECAIREAFEEAALKIRPEELIPVKTVTADNGKPVHIFYTVVNRVGVEFGENSDISQDIYPDIHPNLDPDKEVKGWLWIDPKNFPADLSKPKNVNRLEGINMALMKYHGLTKACVELGLLEKLEKGRKAVPVGTRTKHGDVEVIKTEKGWRPVGTGGKRGRPKKVQPQPQTTTTPDPNVKLQSQLNTIKNASQEQVDKWIATRVADGRIVGNEGKDKISQALLERKAELTSKPKIEDVPPAGYGPTTEEAAPKQFSEHFAIQNEKPTAFQKWFDTFLTEKNLSDQSWNIEGPDGTNHIIDTDEVKELVANAPAHEQARIKDQLVKIDFANGDVNHFFNYLARAFVNTQGGHTSETAPIAQGTTKLKAKDLQVGMKVKTPAQKLQDAKGRPVYSASEIGEVTSISGDFVSIKTEDGGRQSYNTKTFNNDEFELISHNSEVKQAEKAPWDDDKERGFAIGTHRTWQGVEYVKTANGWERVSTATKNTNYDVDKSKENAKLAVNEAAEKYHKLLNDPNANWMDVDDAKKDFESITQSAEELGAGKADLHDQIKQKESAKSLEEEIEAARKKQEELNKSKDPRELADELERRRREEEYFNARESQFSNLGEDLKGSARHKRGEYSANLAQMEADGVAEKLLTRDNILKHNPVNLPEVTADNLDVVLYAHFAIAGFPSKPDYKWGTSESGEKRRQDYKKYFDQYKKMVEEKASEYANNPRIVEMVTQYSSDGGKSQKPSDVTMRRFVGELRAESKKLIADARLNKGIDGRWDSAVTSVLVKNHNNNLKEYARSGKSASGRLNEFTYVVASNNLDPIEAANDVILEGESISSIAGKKKAKGFSPADIYVNNVAERVGGESIPPNFEAQSEYALGTQKIRGIQWGNSVTDSERLHHMQKSAEAFKDLTDILGLPEEMASFNGRLGLAVGARGKGTASAHYEVSTKVINLTRKNGVGTLAHEWGHFFDHIAGSLANNDQTLSGQFATNGLNNRRKDLHPVQEAFKALDEHPGYSQFTKRAKELARKLEREDGLRKGTKYWNSDVELFARAFEAHVNHKLEKAGRKNTYLTNKSYGGDNSDGFSLWPNPKESEAMAPAFDAIFAAFKNSDMLKKAVEYLDRVRTEQSLLEKLQKGGPGSGVIGHETLSPEKIKAIRQKHGYVGPYMVKQAHLKSKASGKWLVDPAGNTTDDKSKAGTFNDVHHGELFSRQGIEAHPTGKQMDFSVISPYKRGDEHKADWKPRLLEA